MRKGENLHPASALCSTGFPKTLSIIIPRNSPTTSLASTNFLPPFSLSTLYLVETLLDATWAH